MRIKRIQINNYYNIKEFNCTIDKKEVKKMQTEANSEIVNANKRCDEINKIIRKLYEDNVSGRITDERFDYLSKSYEEEQNE